MSDKVFLTSKSDITTQIRVIFERAKIIKCAVAFWGDRAPFILGLNSLNKPVQIICNFESGACNPKIIRELLGIPKVGVKSHERLHAKVYWTEYGAIVGSSNASANGLSFESYEINGWLEANILVNEPEILKQIELWFDELWQKSHSIDSTQIDVIEKFWQRRRNIRNVPGIKLGSSLLTALEQNRDNFKDFNVFVLISRHDLSQEATNTFKNWAKQENIQSSQVSCYESWNHLQADSTVISLYYGPRGGFAYLGLWYISDPKIDIRFKYSKGEKGHITVCFARQDLSGLILKEEDVSLLKEKIDRLYHSAKAIHDGDGRLISLYDAYSVLFGNG